VVGGLVALAATGYSLSFTASIGFIALIGIEIKNSILLVDFTNQLRQEGLPLREAIERAGEVRFLPVVLTTMTAVGALVPLATSGSAMYSPLGRVGEFPGAESGGDAGDVRVAAAEGEQGKFRVTSCSLWVSPGGGTRPSMGVARCQSPIPR
jgi:AcrB/AcrD/AcrF family